MNWLLDAIFPEGSFVRDVLLTVQSDEEYYTHVDEMLNPEVNDNPDWYNSIQIEGAKDSPPDYFYVDGTKGWRYTDQNGDIKIYWEYPE